MCVITLKKGHWLLGKHHARVIFPFIFVQQEYKNDKGLIQHEKTHIKQVLQGRAFLYFFSKESRYKLELEAYKVQLKVNMELYLKEHLDQKERIAFYFNHLASKYAGFMSSNYNLKPGTLQRAHKAFMDYYTIMIRELEK